LDHRLRPLFNRAFCDALFARFVRRMEDRVGPFPFRVAETPLLMTHALRDLLARYSTEIVGRLSEPRLLERLKQAVPSRYDVPGMDELPNCVQVDFAVTREADGTFGGRVVELQAFPSLYALMSVMADAWTEELNLISGMEGKWSCFIGMDKEPALELMRRAILGGEAPEDVVLVDLAPEQQKTSPDFAATRLLFGVDSVCVTRLVKDGRRLLRELPGGGRREVRRIYNRMVFDELDVKGAKVPFRWTDDLDVTWCSHPNWYWVWSKYALPFLEHEAVPTAVFLSELESIPPDLSLYVLKPLFSFAGSGVVVDVTREAIERVPSYQRGQWVLQRKIDYAAALPMPDGSGVKAEVRVMLIRPPGEQRLVPLICLVRLSRGKMLGVDFNKNLTWVGGSVGLWHDTDSGLPLSGDAP
jgi:hypothetical protein